MATTTPIQNRPTTHPNNGNQPQPVNVSTQQFTSGGSGIAKTEEQPKKPERKDFQSGIEYVKAIKKWHDDVKAYNDRIGFIDKNKETSLIDEATLDDIFSEYSPSEHEFYKGNPDKAMDHIVDLIDQDSLKELLDAGVGEGEEYMAADPSIRGYKVPTVPAIFQRLIFGNSKANSMSRQEFDAMTKKDFTEEMNPDYESIQCIDIDKVSQAGKVVVYRGLNSIDTNQLPRVKAGFYSNGPQYSKTLIGRGGNFGCVIYMSANKNYSMNGYAYSDLLVGVVDTDPSKARIHDFYDQDKDEKKDFDYLNENSGDLAKKAKEKLLSLGADETQASRIASSIEMYLSDEGFESMVLGYDLIIGDSNQLDVINPNVLTMVRE